MNSSGHSARGSRDLGSQGVAGTVWTNQNVRETLALIDRSLIGATLYVDGDGRVLGLVTDGDIRRALIAGASVTDPVSSIWNAAPVALSPRTSVVERYDLLAARGLNHLVLVDVEGKGARLQTFKEVSELYDLNRRRCPVLLMAGGRGQRLMPLTATTPKPMIEIDGRPLLLHTIERLASQGYQELYISVGYLRELIINYFGDGSKFGVSIEYLVENRPHGTGGCLRLLPPLKHPTFIMMNGDVINDLNLRSLVTFHEEERFLATMTIHEAREKSAYGVVRAAGTVFVGLDEKPERRFYINTGIYAVSTAALEHIPELQEFDMPDLFARMTAMNLECGVYEHRGQWLDIGDKDQLAMAHTFLESTTPNTQRDH